MYVSARALVNLGRECVAVRVWMCVACVHMLCVAVGVVCVQNAE